MSTTVDWAGETSNETKSRPTTARLRWIDRAARSAFAGRMGNLRTGQLTIVDPSGTLKLGDPAAELAARIEINNPRFYLRTIVGGSLAAGEAYVRGEWDCDDLPSLFRMLTADSEAGGQLDGLTGAIGGWFHRLVHRLRANTRHGSRRNIEVHYDLGNDFFELMLDDTLAYSSGVFTSPECSLREASIEKMDRICRKLDLRSTDRVLEIGTGWGGWALHAAAHYGCHVTTTTLSRRQVETAARRIDEAGLTNRVTLLNTDYRDLTGRYDKLVSIEMIEAVGHRYLDTFFRKCGELLKPDGSMALQAIVMPDRNYGRYLKSVDFIQRRVFPGGCLPSLGAITASTARTTELRFAHAENFGPHYARTLAAWRTRFESRLYDVRRLGYGEEFIRLWRYYLCYCEAAFEARYLGLVQLVFEGPRCRRDPIEMGVAAGSPRRDALEESV